MPSVGFEPTFSAGELPQTYALDRATTGTGKFYVILLYNFNSACFLLSTKQNSCISRLFSAIKFLSVSTIIQRGEEERDTEGHPNKVAIGWSGGRLLERG